MAARATYPNITAAQVVSINTALSSSFSSEQLGAILEAVNTALAVATTGTRGMVLTAAARADNASTIPAAAPAGGTGTAAGGWDTAGNRDAAITTINGLRTAISDLKTEHNDLLAKLRAAGILAS